MCYTTVNVWRKPLNTFHLIYILYIYIFFLYYFSIPVNISILQLLCLLYAIYIRDRIFKKNAN